MNNTQTRLTGLCACILLLSGCIGQTTEETAVKETSQAPDQQNDPRPEEHRYGRGLMQDAFNACSGKSENDSCELNMNGTVINGSCAVNRRGNITCMPPELGWGNGTNPGRNGLRQEAQDACNGKPENSTCDFITGGHILNGTCGGGHTGELACFPANRGPGLPRTGGLRQAKDHP